MATSLDKHLSQQRISPGTRLSGIYEVRTLIAAGSLGKTYKGCVIQTGDLVAIKFLLPELAHNEPLALVREEVSRLQYLQHDAIVRYYVFTVEPVLQRPYLVMEFVEGRSLSDVLEKDGPLTFEAVRALMRRIAAGLQAAHERGIVHRDVSPDNIILPLGDVARAKIVDFRIGRPIELTDRAAIDSFGGKYNYVAPEQLGLFRHNITAKTDIYSLGLVLVHALTGRAIDMGGSQFESVEKHRTLPDLGAIDMRLRPLLEQMLQPNPAGRPESVAMCASALLGAINGDGGTTSSPPPSGPLKKKFRNAKYALATAALITIMVGVGYSVLTMDVGVQSPKQLSDLVPASNAPEQVAPPDTFAPPAASTGPAPASRTDAIERYVKQYNGGDCFFITPVAIDDTKARLEGFGASIRSFEILDDAFRKQIGFAADIGVRQVSPEQCPAINFIAHLAKGQLRSPRIDIDKTRLNSRDTLNGSLDQYGSRAVQLFLVGPRGHIHSVPLAGGADAQTFALRIRPTGDTSEPVLLVAVAGDGLQDLSFDKPAAEFFSDILNWAGRTKRSLSAAIRYFRLDP